MIIEQLENALRELESAQERYAYELSTLPDGKLICWKKRGKNVFLHGKEENGTYTRKGIGKKPWLIQQLVRKMFLGKALERVEHNCGVVRRALNDYQPCQPQGIVEELTASKYNIPREYFHDSLVDPVALKLDGDAASRIAAHQDWGAQPYTAPVFRPDGRTVVTSRGEYMRSKGEVMIAEKLYEYGIPFRYEQELVLFDRTMHPDFTFEGANGEEFYLEFCGMMDDPEYVKQHNRKYDSYRNADIVPWKNIIYVYAAGNDMNMMYIDAVIRLRIIPWL